MTQPPPDDLKSWSKNALVRELRRLRAVTREHASQVNPAHSGGDVVDVAGDPQAQGGAIIDMRGAVLLDHCEVVLVDRGTPDARVAMVLRLSGRINYSQERADTTYVMGGDGGAGIVTEIVGLSHRAAASETPDGLAFATEFQEAVQGRLEDPDLGVSD